MIETEIEFRPGVIHSVYYLNKLTRGKYHDVHCSCIPLQVGGTRRRIRSNISLGRGKKKGNPGTAYSPLPSPWTPGARPCVPKSAPASRALQFVARSNVMRNLPSRSHSNSSSCVHESDVAREGTFFDVAECPLTVNVAASHDVDQTQHGTSLG